jgi:hypothetical protein
MCKALGLITSTAKQTTTNMHYPVLEEKYFHIERGKSGRSDTH